MEIIMAVSQIPDINDISYFIRAGKNSYKVKVKKLLTILTTFIIENSSFNKDSKDEKKLEEKISKSIYRTQFETVFNLKYSKLDSNIRKEMHKIYSYEVSINNKWFALSSACKILIASLLKSIKNNDYNIFLYPNDWREAA